MLSMHWNMYLGPHIPQCFNLQISKTKCQRHPDTQKKNQLARALFHCLYMASMRVSLVTALWLTAMVCSELRVYSYEEELAPTPALTTGSAFASSASIVLLGFSLLFYVLGVFMH
jgi:hypothetical protein